MWLLVAFIAVPLIEIALFIQVGGWLGLWPTLGIVIATAFAGAYLVRSQGRAEIERLRGRLRTLSDPTEPLAHGAMILFSGALLLTPGFFTDAVGFALLVPGVRRWLAHELGRRVVTRRFEMGPGRPAGPQAGAGGPGVIDGEWQEVTPPESGSAPRDDRRAPPHGPSGWARRD